MNSIKSRERGIFRVTLVGTLVNVLLLVFKFIAGWLGNSAAMIADAVHSLTDFITDIIVILFVRIAGKPEDESHDYGHGKYETLATAIIGIILLVVGVGIAFNGIVKVIAVIRGEVVESPGMIALIAATLSMVMKEFLYRYTQYKGRELDSSVVVANAWHHRSDALSSVGTLLGVGGAILLGDRWLVLDPLAAVIVSLFILRVAYQLIRQCIDELLERSLQAEVEDKIISLIVAYPDVTQPHHLRTRRIGKDIAIEVHIRMDGNIPLWQAHERSIQIESDIKAHFGANTHIGIHMEPIKFDGKYQNQ